MQTKLFEIFYISFWSTIFVSEIQQVVTMSNAQKLSFCLWDTFRLYKNIRNHPCQEFNLSNSKSISEICSDTCNIVQERSCRPKERHTKVRLTLIFNNSNATTFGVSRDFLVNMSCDVSSLLSTTGSDMATSKDPKDLSYKTLYGSSIGAAIAGLIFGIMLTFIIYLIRDRIQKKKTKPVLNTVDSTHNDNDPPCRDIQMSDVYNEITEENKSKVVEVMPMAREQPHFSTKSNPSFGVYNHLHESPVTDRDDEYDHAYFMGIEEDSGQTRYGTTNTDPPPEERIKTDEVINSNYSLLQKEIINTRESDENKES